MTQTNTGCRVLGEPIGAYQPLSWFANWCGFHLKGGRFRVSRENPPLKARSKQYA